MEPVLPAPVNLPRVIAVGLVRRVWAGVRADMASHIKFHSSLWARRFGARRPPDVGGPSPSIARHDQHRQVAGAPVAVRDPLGDERERSL